MNAGEIHEIFLFFGLESEEKRKEVLQQGHVYVPCEERINGIFYLDNSTDEKPVEVKNA